MGATICLLMLLPQVSTADVQDLVKQLDADRFVERREASQRLAEMGAGAFDELVKAAESSSAEVQNRSLDIIQNHFRNGEADTREAAKRALEKIAERDTRSGRAARDILAPPANIDPAAQAAMARNLQIQLALQARQAALPNRVLPNGVRRVNNGVQQRRIQFSDGKISVKIEINGQQIKMEVTEKDANGNSQTKKYEAKDEAELKQKHPEAYQIYTKHTQARAANIQLPMRGARVAAPAIPNQARQRIEESLKRSQEQLKKQMEEAEKLQGDEKQRTLDNLKRREESLKKALERYSDLQKQEQPAPPEPAPEQAK
ncbi:MAG: hypothetical protein KDB14_10355 [Planctomycetales bacterium]|nr:hypothetical protein [Planctomycetales bacterium]